MPPDPAALSAAIDDLLANGDDVDTRSFYVGDQVPLLYVALKPGPLPTGQGALARIALAFGLPRWRHDRPDRPEGQFRPAAIGWEIHFDWLGPGDPAPLMSVAWPVGPEPFVYGVRKTSPPGWADDAVTAGAAVVMCGPSLDWPRLVDVPDPEGLSGGIMRTGNLLTALDGRLAAAGIVPVSASRPS